MLKPVKLLLLFVLSVTALTAWAQKPASGKPVTVQKFTPPKLTCVLGIHADSATVFKEEAVQLVKLPLKITDDKKNVYTISSYRFKYTRRVVTENEETGKALPAISEILDLFRTTPLPDLWRNTIAEQIKPGEELYFFDIVVTDAQGRYMFAPTLRIKVK
ncbi:MAG: hypothetical protein WBP16_09895 [Ferruginibacter sp.]